MHRNVIQGVSTSNVPWVSVTPRWRKEGNCFGYMFLKGRYFAWSWDLIIFTRTRHDTSPEIHLKLQTVRLNRTYLRLETVRPQSHPASEPLPGQDMSPGLHIFLLLLLRFFLFISSDLGFCHVVYTLDKMRVWRGTGSGTELTPAHTTMGLIGCSRSFDFRVNVCCECLKPHPLHSFRKEVVQTKRSLICWVKLLDIGVKH